MIFNFRLGDKEYAMDLSPELRVAITRDLIKLHKEYCTTNPSENIDFEMFLNLVEASPHPENEGAPPVPDESDEYVDEDVDEDVLLLGEVIKRKDVMIDALLEALSKLK